MNNSCRIAFLALGATIPLVAMGAMAACGTPRLSADGVMPNEGVAEAASEASTDARGVDEPSAASSGTAGSMTSEAGGTPVDGATGSGGGSGSADALVASDGGTDAESPADAGTLGDATDDAHAAIAATPPMGWNTWNTFRCAISESLIRTVADAMVRSGMKAAGYEYVNLDDCWMNGRDSGGNLRWDATKFPSGLPALAAALHAQGLKLGIYETPNTVTCVGIYGGISPAVAVGSLGHETQDANTFASWGVDLLKFDLCKGNRNDFATMRDALRATGRPIVYSINPGNGPNDLYPPMTAGWDPRGVAHMWRFAYDISLGYAGTTLIIDQDGPLWTYAGPGHWNDADIMNVGRGMTVDEDRSHFSMWAMLNSPLLAGNDIRSMSATTQSILTNSDVIAVNQDPLGNQAQLVATPQPNVQIWSKTLAGHNIRAVAILNRSTAVASVTVPWTAIGLAAGSATVRDLWARTDLGTFAQSHTVSAIPSHGVVVLRIAGLP
ncbi:MAG: glycoside hydrolase family 27 protein [Myxococcota bacterium]|nr:glycoside hydrolase family 27 protein [Myxococcota bacterium]